LEKHYKLSGGRGLDQFWAHLKPIREAFGDMRAVDVTPKIVDDYIEDRLAGDKKAGIRPKAAATIFVDCHCSERKLRLRMLLGRKRRSRILFVDVDFVNLSL
jgi:CHAD domain-containing protein